MTASDGRLDQGQDLALQEAQLQRRTEIIAARPTAAERPRCSPRWKPPTSSSAPASSPPPTPTSTAR